MTGTAHPRKMAGMVVSRGMRRLSVAVAGALAGAAVWATSGTLAAGGDPVIMAAGDIACASSGISSAGAVCSHAYTAGLLRQQRDSGRLDAVLALGDNQYTQGTLSQYTQYFGSTWGADGLKELIRPVLGDAEDETDATARGYFDYFNGAGQNDGPAGPRGKGYYSFDLGNWHLIALDVSNECKAGTLDEGKLCRDGTAQSNWLKADLAGSSKPCTLAYFHEPLAEGPYVKHFWQVLYNAHADVILSGHHHWYAVDGPKNPSKQADSKGVREFIVGTGGEEGGDTGVLKLTLKAAGYDWQYVGADSTSIGPAGQPHTGAGSCNAKSGGGNPPPPPPLPPPAPPTTPPAPPATPPAPPAPPEPPPGPPATPPAPPATPPGPPSPPPPPSPGPGPGSSAVLSGLRLASVQRGPTIRGSVVIGEDGSQLRVDVSAPSGRSAKLASAGRAVRSAVMAGRQRFSVTLSRQARAMLRRQRQLRVKVTLRATPPEGRTVVIARRVLVRR
jgi:hypothetical protein